LAPILFRTVGNLGSKMSRTMWLAVFCLIGLGPAIAIMVAAPASLVVERAQHQSQMNPAFALAKSDRLELPNARAETDIIAPATKLMPADTPSTSPEAVKKVDDGHWQNANAKTMSPSPRRHTKSKESMQSPGKYPPNERAEVWHCRQDAVGSLLRSLDLSPRCHL
jgi:hypothetical protein